MKNKRNLFLVVALLAGAIIGGAALINSESLLFASNQSNSTSELSMTLASNGINESVNHYSTEKKCGEGAKESEAKEKESKSSEVKCGEGKCGSGDGDAKEEKSSDKKEESKSTEAKCGEGKCGK